MTNAKVGIDAILEVQGASRASRAYAFLYAAFKRSEVNDSPVRDAVDCLKPFIIAHLNANAGQQVHLPKLQEYLRTFMFEIPLYALEQIMPSLQEEGHLKYDKRLKAHISIAKDDTFTVAKEEIETDFDFISETLKNHASSLGFMQTPSAGTWSDALIDFLKQNFDDQAGKVISHKGVLINSKGVESSIVASFIREAQLRYPIQFDAILRVFMGTLIEDFISTISEIGDKKGFRDLYAFYDTSVLLRLLGCSGTLLRVATDELNRYLQDLGIQIAYFAGNESEVEGVLSAIVSAKDYGGEVFGETADAISNGEISIADLRLLRSSFVEQLAKKGVFAADALEGQVAALKQYQIDEASFSTFLSGRAARNNRAYSIQNLRNDASFLGHIMRLRKGKASRDLSESKFVFVTTNRLFANCARQFLMKESIIKGVHCPPVLHVGQMATIAWLMRERKIDPEKAGRELLTNCYAAIRPDASWFQDFRAAIEKVVGNIDDFSAVPENSLKLQAARRIAQNQTFGNASLVRQLNAAEVLQAADREAEAEKERLRAEGDMKANALAELARQTGESDAIQARKIQDIARAQLFAGKLRAGMSWLFIALFICATALFDQSALWGGKNYTIALVQLFFFIPAIIGIFDLFGYSPVKGISLAVEKFLFRKIYDLISGN